MDKSIFRLGATICLVISAIFFIPTIFIITDKMLETITQMFGSFFLLMALVLQALAGKKMVDERAIRISAKANQWGILSLLIYCISVALLAKHDPGITSVPIALMGAVFVFFIPSFIAFQILKSMPNAEVDKWETK